MATIALPRPLPPHRSSSSTIASLASPLTIDTLNPQPEQCPPAVPNKHIPVCPPGPVPRQEPSTPPPSPGKHDDCAQSLLHPPTHFVRLESGPLTLYELSVADVALALDYASRQPLPEPSQVFPWFHGLHPLNHLQQSFFTARSRSLRRTPFCLRGITVVKADGDLAVSRLKGAISPHEFLHCSSSSPEFHDVDPKEGFSVRNFQIQAAKSAMTSDIIVYGDDPLATRKMACDIAAAQLRWRERHEAQGHPIPAYNTFVCVSPFEDFEENHPELVAVDSAGLLTGNVIDFVHQERKEMFAMTKPTAISHNVWMGPTLDRGSDEDKSFDIQIECSDMGRLHPAALQAIAEGSAAGAGQHCLDFPSSGSILPSSWSHAEADGIIETCKWIYHLAHGTYPATAGNDEDQDTDMVGEAPPSPYQVPPQKVLIHCGDGYTESTMLGIAYYSYSTGRPVPDAWLNLHTTLGRNFFAYPADVSLLTAIAPRLLSQSPALTDRTPAEIQSLAAEEPEWLPGIDGSFPSRVLDYMYLGNLGHANNPDLLKALGIKQILSVGETTMWRDGELEKWGAENVCLVQGVQDNGIDPLTEEFERCLEFIDQGRRNGTATLVHCRVGVSRSATICIAEVMRAMDLSFPRAYCFVRARRLNVIIQPHLRFAYELLKWEETLQRRKNTSKEAPARLSIKRELEWAEIAREIALMNRPYAR
ncbi:dual specificity phosphatase [Diaporthe amygdali]|uniref:dual specificity phosphatase n=1 Tax=Phomopsis amygdali TaxID=1214568 RepID=UPI0022FDE925|nr:dual specificity phosphatase [Diaporthe amygdali]KAJ0125525.1 dual specificity phosphatase [Diaporthe amygdali]